MNTKDRANVYRVVFVICLLLSSIFLLSEWIEIKSLIGNRSRDCTVFDLANNKVGGFSVYMEDGFKMFFKLAKYSLIVTLIDNVFLLFTVLYPKGLQKSWPIHIFPVTFTVGNVLVSCILNSLVSITPNINFLWIVIFSVAAFVCCYQFFQLIDEEPKEENDYVDCYTCPLCGIEISENANFCPNCGAHFQHDAPAPSAPVHTPTPNTPNRPAAPSNMQSPAPDPRNINNYRVCPNCGNTVWWQAESCPVCGAAVRQSSPSPLPSHYGIGTKPPVVNKQSSVTRPQPTASAPSVEQSDSSQEYILCSHCYRVIDKNAEICPYCNEFVQSNKQ